MIVLGRWLYIILLILCIPRRLFNYWLDSARDLILVADEPKNTDIAALYRVFLVKYAGKRSSERIRVSISIAS